MKVSLDNTNLAIHGASRCEIKVLRTTHKKFRGLARVARGLRA